MELSPFLSALAWVLPIIFAVTLHEAAHGWVAEQFGDNTARSLGRVTFNPLKHIDNVGTIILPGLLLLSHSPVLFGYAKPVPVNFNNMEPRRLGMFVVALAGPGTNIILALISAFLLNLGEATATDNMNWWQLNCFNSVVINCALAIFNMIPILPLDGGRVLRASLPGEIGNKYAQTERYGMIVVFALILFLPLTGITVITDTIIFIDEWLIKTILSIMA